MKLEPLFIGASPDATALITDDGEITWQGLEDRIRGVAARLGELGLEPEERVALLAHNSVDFVAIAFASLAFGTRLVPVNWHLAPPEIEYLLADSGASVLFVDPALNAHLEGIAIPPTVLIDDAFRSDVRARAAVPLPAERLAGHPLIYTGGTTGRSKGVWRAARHDVPTTIAGLRGWGARLGFPADGRGLVTTPLYHAWGLSSLSTLLCSAISVVLRQRFDERALLADVARYSVTTLPLVPAQMVRLAKLSHDDRARFDTSSLRFAIHTAAPCPPWAKRELIDWWGPIITEYYGSSDGAGPVVCTSEDWLARPGTVGRPVAGVEIKVVDENGNEAAVGHEGTIYFRRPDGPPEYFGDQAKTAGSRIDGGFYTVGDFGYVDADGFVYLVDRRDDLILVGGTNVYSAEVESVLSEHPAVRDVAVIGVSDERLGQRVHAVVQQEPGTATTAEELMTFCAQRLARFKVPSSIAFVDELPREAHGKLKKRLLRP